MAHVEPDAEGAKEVLADKVDREEEVEQEVVVTLGAHSWTLY